MGEKVPTRQEALELLHQYNQTESLRKHAYAVEGVMRYIARKRPIPPMSQEQRFPVD